jgi:hypothetical protein
MASRGTSRVDKFKGIVADLARPFAIISTAAASSWAIVVIAYQVHSGESGAIFIAAVMTGLGALYGAKSWENAKAGAHSAEVEKVRATQSPPPVSALQPADPLQPADGELPAAERVTL